MISAPLSAFTALFIDPQDSHCPVPAGSDDCTMLMQQERLARPIDAPLVDCYHGARTREIQQNSALCHLTSSDKEHCFAN